MTRLRCFHSPISSPMIVDSDMGASSILHLPDEPLRMIAHMLLKRSDLLNFMLTCHTVHRAISSVLYWYPRLWTRRKLYTFRERLLQDRSLAGLVRKLRIDVPLVPVGADREYDEVTDGELADEILCLCHSSLELLTINPESWSKTIRCCDRLRTLNIFLAVLKIDLQKEISFLPSLRILGLEFYHNRQILNAAAFSAPQLEELRIDLREAGEGIDAASFLVKGCRNLRTLNFRASHSPSTFQYLGEALSSTRTLERLLFRNDIAQEPASDSTEFGRFLSNITKTSQLKELYVTGELLRQLRPEPQVLAGISALGLLLASLSDIVALEVLIDSRETTPQLETVKISTSATLKDGSWASAAIARLPRLCLSNNIAFYSHGRSENVPQMSWFI
ncbi:hypothetical protein BT69DRAFT_709169 [Atractiella rhizophila]|nr:hypothetical protein BT69DRAFT_709169 [Atractiella rhizophila]